MSHRKNEREIARLLRSLVYDAGGDTVEVVRQGRGAHIVYDLGGPWGRIRYAATRSDMDPRAMRNMRTDVRKLIDAQARKRT